MLIRSNANGFNHSISSEITSRSVYESRRDLLKLWGTGAAGAALASIAARDARANTSGGAAGGGVLPKLPGTKSNVSGANVMETVTTYKDASTYNNFYEFGTDKADPARNAKTLITKPWTVQITGAVKKNLTLSIEDLLKVSAMEERIYRFRCVEGWSMVIPWVGYSLSELIKRAEPLGNAKYVEFITLADKTQMNGLSNGSLDFPYVEALRMDEAMHPLTMLVYGMYGEVLPNQNGAPLRLMSPWKYGFKGGKSIVQIRFTEKEPKTSWNKAAPQEYGFFSNVNPNVDHPRWSQATERRIGEEGGIFAKKRKTLMFNGYEQQVGQLYAGMDLKKFY
jgi:methionine sulfoxide reductase catalytic subunit